MSSPRSFNSASPFSSTVYEYLEKGWSPLPLPPKRKEHPPVGYTGRAGRFATRDDIADWLLPYKKGNIAVRLGNSIDIEGVLHEVIGIDVDAYGDKKGGENLRELEKKHGKLPETWISSSRTDGISGIRYFLVPYGYGFKGQAAKCIDIIQRVHRYSVVYPSWHPETKAQYRWYAPGFKPSERIPAVLELAFLPDDWLKELTNGKTLDGDGQYGIDLDSTPEELKAWRTRVFNDGPPCEYIVRQVKNWIKRIEESPSNHDVITRAHWHLMLSGAEGHTGVEAAIQKINSVWLADIESKQKRSISSAKREVVRSYWGSLRKLKAMADGFAEGNLALFSSEVCMSDWRKPPVKCSIAELQQDHWIYRIPLADKGIDPVDFENNDVGQAKHFLARVKDNVRWVSDFKAWVIYDGVTWHLDDLLIRNLFDRATVPFNKKRAQQLWVEMENYLKQPGHSNVDSKYKVMQAQRKGLNDAANKYRGLRNVDSALKMAQSEPHVSIKYNELNWDRTILAMPNGKCLKLDEPGKKPVPNAKGFRIIDNEKRFLTTMMTACEYTEDLELEEKQLWDEYLDLFLPDLEYRRFVQKALGHTLIGFNAEKLAIFMVGIPHTGKSTMLAAVQTAYADYAETFQPNSLFKDVVLNPELGNLLHRRVICSSESGSQRIFANPFKRNTGRDKISITRKNANEQVTGVPHFTILVGTNLPPTIDDADEATVNRIMVLPFTIQVSPEQDDKNGINTIPKEAMRAVLKWLVEGYVDYIRTGLDSENWPDIVKAAKIDFSAELSDVATFLSENCIVAPDDIKKKLNKDVISFDQDELRREWQGVSQMKLYQAYKMENEDSSQKILSPRQFTKKVKSLFGVEVVLHRLVNDPVKCYRGLKWRKDSSVLRIIQ